MSKLFNILGAKLYLSVQKVLIAVTQRLKFFFQYYQYKMKYKLSPLFIFIFIMIFTIGVLYKIDIHSNVWVFISDTSPVVFHVGMLSLALIGVFKLKSEIRSKRRYELSCELFSACCTQVENIVRYTDIKEFLDKKVFFPTLRESTEKLSDAVNKANLILKEDCNAKEHAAKLAYVGEYVVFLHENRRNTRDDDCMRQFAQKIIHERDYNKKLNLLGEEKQKLVDLLKKYT